MTTEPASLSTAQATVATLPEDGIFVDELTQVGYVARLAFPVYRPRTFLAPGYQGTLGWGYAAALGAKAARQTCRSSRSRGDGGFMFNVQEMATAVAHRCPVADRSTRRPDAESVAAHSHATGAVSTVGDRRR